MTEEGWTLLESLVHGESFAISRADFSEEIACAVGLMMKEDPRSRYELADDLSAFTSEKISKEMLDAYASKARKEHNIPAHRMLAITAITGRWDILNAVFQRLGVFVATRKDVEFAKLGNAYRAMRSIERSLESRFSEE